MLVDKQLPRNKDDKLYKYSYIDFTGQSFLVHPDVLLYQAYKYSYREIAVYIALASLRPYGEYKVYGTTTLDPLRLKEDPYYFINNNRLLYLEEGRLCFLHEEVPTEIN